MTLFVVSLSPALKNWKHNSFPASCYVTHFEQWDKNGSPKGTSQASGAHFPIVLSFLYAWDTVAMAARWQSDPAL